MLNLDLTRKLRNTGFAPKKFRNPGSSTKNSRFSRKSNAGTTYSSLRKDSNTIKSPLSLSHKVIIIGDINVGKTCLLLKFCDHPFPDKAASTIGFDFYEKVISISSQNIQVSFYASLRFWSFTSEISSFLLKNFIIFNRFFFLKFVQDISVMKHTKE